MESRNRHHKVDSFAAIVRDINRRSPDALYMPRREQVLGYTFGSVLKEACASEDPKERVEAKIVRRKMRQRRFMTSAIRAGGLTLGLMIAAGTGLAITHANEGTADTPQRSEKKIEVRPGQQQYNKVLAEVMMQPQTLSATYTCASELQAEAQLRIQTNTDVPMFGITSADLMGAAQVADSNFVPCAPMMESTVPVYTAQSGSYSIKVDAGTLTRFDISTACRNVAEDRSLLVKNPQAVGAPALQAEITQYEHVLRNNHMSC